MAAAVSGLGYVAFNVRDIDAWVDIATHVFGMEVKPRGNGIHDLRVDDLHHRITLYPADTDGVAAVGWEAGSVEDLDALVAQVRARQIDVVEADKALKDERKVRELYVFTDPNLNVRTELFYGPLSCNLAFKPSRGISGYRTGPGLGLGHVVFHTGDLKGTVDFYMETLGFKISDYIAWDDKDAVFLHCNPRHHTLAIMNTFGPVQPGDFNHLMLEARSFDDVGYAYDIVRDRGVPLFMELGKHTNDHMQSFYIRTPSGFCIEYGYGGRLIGEDWEIRHYDQPMLYGHRFVG